MAERQTSEFFSQQPAIARILKDEPSFLSPCSQRQDQVRFPFLQDLMHLREKSFFSPNVFDSPGSRRSNSSSKNSSRSQSNSQLIDSDIKPDQIVLMRHANELVSQTVLELSDNDETPERCEDCKIMLTNQPPCDLDSTSICDEANFNENYKNTELSNLCFPCQIKWKNLREHGQADVMNNPVLSPVSINSLLRQDGLPKTPRSPLINYFKKVKEEQIIIDESEATPAHVVDEEQCMFNDPLFQQVKIIHEYHQKVRGEDFQCLVDAYYDTKVNRSRDTGFDTRFCSSSGIDNDRNTSPGLVHFFKEADLGTQPFSNYVVIQDLCGCGHHLPSPDMSPICSPPSLGIEANLNAQDPVRPVSNIVNSENDPLFLALKKIEGGKRGVDKRTPLSPLVSPNSITSFGKKRRTDENNSPALFVKLETTAVNTPFAFNQCNWSLSQDSEGLTRQVHELQLSDKNRKL